MKQEKQLSRVISFKCARLLSKLLQSSSISNDEFKTKTLQFLIHSCVEWHSQSSDAVVDIDLIRNCVEILRDNVDCVAQEEWFDAAMFKQLLNSLIDYNADDNNNDDARDEFIILNVVHFSIDFMHHYETNGENEIIRFFQTHLLNKVSKVLFVFKYQYY